MDRAIARVLGRRMAAREEGLTGRICERAPSRRGCPQALESGLCPTPISDHWKGIETALVKFDTPPRSRYQAVKL